MILMKSIGLILILIATIACDTPQRSRTPFGDPVSTSSDNGSQGVVDNSNNNDQTSNDGITDDGGSSNNTGFENCNLEYRYFATNIGYFGLCQNEAMENKFKLKMNESDLQYGTCFVPVHVQTDGTSYKLGIAECVRNEKDKEYQMILTKDRPEAINGVMVVKAIGINAYMQCMSAKVDFINAYPGCQYDPACLQAADNYANSVCSQFVNTYSNDYKQVFPLD